MIKKLDHSVRKRKSYNFQWSSPSSTERLSDGVCVEWIRLKICHTIV